MNYSLVIELFMQYSPPCVLENVVRNMHGLNYLLVHIDRNSPCKPEKNVVFDEKFEELH